MSVLFFDTLEAEKRLVECGLSPKKAEGVVVVTRDVFAAKPVTGKDLELLEEKPGARIDSPETRIDSLEDKVARLEARNAGTG